MNCPQCNSCKVRKNGHQDGKGWGRIFRDSYEQRGYHPQVKEICLKMYFKESLASLAFIIPNYIEPEKHTVLPKTKLTRVEGENTRLRH